MGLKIFRVAGSRGQEDRARETMVNNSQPLSPLYLVFKDHKGWHYSSGKPPPTRQIAGGNEGHNIHLSEINSEILESVVEAYEGGIEVISTEDMNATWEELNIKNEGWTPGSWWDGIEDNDYITCGSCWDSNENICNRNQDKDNNIPSGRNGDKAGPKGWKPDKEPQITAEKNEDETMPKGWKQKFKDNKRTMPEGTKEEKHNKSINIVKEVRKDKLRITRKYMIERRKKRWIKNMSWIEKDLDRLIDIKEANQEDVQDFTSPNGADRVRRGRLISEPGCEASCQAGQQGNPGDRDEMGADRLLGGSPLHRSQLG